MSNDFKKLAPTKMERAMYELYLEHQNLSKQVTALNQILYAAIAMLEAQGGFDFAEFTNTMHNQVRMNAVRAKMMAAEMQALKDFKETEEKKKAAEGLHIPGQEKPAELIVPK